MSILNTSVSGMQANSNWLSTISQNVANAEHHRLQERRDRFLEPGRSDRQRQRRFRRRLHPPRSRSTRSRAMWSPLQPPTDLAVQGAGFFVVSDSSGTLYLTRNGSFTPDASGNLVNSAGYYLMAANVQKRRFAACREFADRPPEGQRRQRRPDRDGDDHRHADRQSAVDRDAGRCRQFAVRQFSKRDLYRSDIACRLR